jgi:outer membrane protein
MPRLILAAIIACAAAPASAQTISATLGPQPAAPEVPRWARVAFFDVGRVTSESQAGKAALATIAALRSKREAEAGERAKALRQEQQKLESGGTVLSAPARAEIAKRIDRFQLDLQRFLEDARAELEATQRDVEEQFRRKLGPAVEKVATQHGLDLVFSRTDAGLFWASEKFDLSAEIVKHLDAAPQPD